MLHGTEASIEVSCHFSLEDLKVLVEFVKRVTICTVVAPPPREPIERALEVYTSLRDNPSEILGVIFDWS